MSGTLFPLKDGYEYGRNLYVTLKNEMPDGKPICCNEDMGLLVQMIQHAGGDHLEIGTAYGGTLIAAVQAMDYYIRDSKVVCIEPFGEERRDTIHKAVEKEFWNNVEHYGIKDRFELIKAFSHPFPIESGRRFATALIDGDHSYKYVLNDWLNVKEVVDKYVMFHDYSKESVREVVIEHAAQDDDWVIAAIHGWSAVMLRKTT